MSTLVPGSEPWQIAEGLEYAADIWKALEEKYGPNSEKKGFDVNDVVHDDNHAPDADGGAWQGEVTGDQQPAASGDNLAAQEVSEGLQDVAELWTHEQQQGQEQEQAVTRSTTAEEDTLLTEEKRRWKDDSMRDQRFLWALLNGGKEEEIIQTNEMKKSYAGNWWLRIRLS